MTTAVITSHPGQRYAGATDRPPVDPEAPSPRRATFGPTPPAAPQLEAACATRASDLEWVPDHELDAIPPAMLDACRRCPLRQTCLSRAIAGGEQGYWAGTTTTDRAQMLSLQHVSTETGDWLQQLAADAKHERRRDSDAAAKHAPGEGSLGWYRRGRCRCIECRAANTAARSIERSRRRQRPATAARLV